MNRYDIDFDAALAFLHVSRSTLNRWLRDGSVPARKVGGQWRFSEDDLRRVRDGADEPPELARAREDLRRFIESARASRKEPPAMNAALDASPRALAEALVWEMHDRKAGDLHLQPRRDGVHVAIRKDGRLETLRVVPPALAAGIEQAWNEIGLPFGETGFRRLFLSRGAAAEVNEISVVMQALDTLQGRRVTLRFMGGGRVADLATVAPHPEDRAVLERWLARPNGVILFAGLPGSGKTTTLLSCLQHQASDAGHAVFSIEHPAVIRVDGVDQVEVPSEAAADVKAAVDRIMRLDPDTVGLCLETPETAAAALDIARSGHVVLMHVEAEGPEAAVKRFEGMAGKPLGGTLIGVVSQKLRKGASGGRVAEYRFWEPPAT